MHALLVMVQVEKVLAHDHDVAPATHRFVVTY